MKKNEKNPASILLIHEDAERVMLASIRKSPGLLDQFALSEMGWKPDMFVIPANRLLFNALVQTYRDNGVLDSGEICFTRTKNYLKEQGLFEDVGGIEGVNAPWAEQLDDWRWAAIQMIKIYRKRQIALSGHEISQIGTDLQISDEAARERVQLINERMAGLYTWRKRRAHKTQLHDALSYIEEQTDAPVSGKITFAVPPLDRLVRGIRPGNYIVISGKTSSGKTALAMQLAREGLKKGKRVVSFCQEMTSVELYVTMISAMSGIDLGDLLEGKIEPDEAESFSTATRAMENWKWHVSEEENLSVEGLIAEVREIAQEYGQIDIVTEDYLQLLEDGNVRYENRQVAVAAQSRKLKNLAKAMSAVVVAISQLNDDGKLRESRAPSHDCSLLINILDVGSDDSVKKLKVGKQRRGVRGDQIEVRFDGARQTFRERSTGQS
jgi:replicative DNA helicase